MPSFSSSRRKAKQHSRGQLFLEFLIDAQTPALVPIAQTQEVTLVSPEQLTPMPNMPSAVLGLLHQRGRVFWVVDLARMLQCQTFWGASREYTLLILQIQPRTQDQATSAAPGQPHYLGLLVFAVKGGVWFPPEAIRPPVGDLSKDLVPYLQGCLPHQDQQLLVLDTRAIAHASVLQPLSFGPPALLNA